MDYGGGEPSRLFRDLLDLEKDFRYNLTLLKIREDEIERCSETNRTLQQNLKSSLAEIERLNVEISNLGAALQGAERRCHHQDQIHQDKMNKLTEDMTSLEREYRQRSEDYKRRTAEKLREVEDDYRRRMEEMKEDFRRKMEIAERKVIEENIINNKIKTELQQLLNENANLRNRLRETQFNSRVYADELKSAQSTIINLNSEIVRLKDELISFQKERHRVELENDNFRRNDEIKSQRNDTDDERRQIESEMGKRKKIGVMEKQQDTGGVENCNVPEHSNYEGILKQNAVLQEVVKALRKERGGEMENIQIAEQRLDRLEMLLCQLKNVF